MVAANTEALRLGYKIISAGSPVVRFESPFAFRLHLIGGAHAPRVLVIAPRDHELEFPSALPLPVSLSL
jgi:hypothetical protein